MDKFSSSAPIVVSTPYLPHCKRDSIDQVPTTTHGRAPRIHYLDIHKTQIEQLPRDDQISI